MIINSIYSSCSQSTQAGRFLTDIRIIDIALITARWSLLNLYKLTCSLTYYQKTCSHGHTNASLLLFITCALQFGTGTYVSLSLSLIFVIEKWSRFFESKFRNVIYLYYWNIILSFVGTFHALIVHKLLLLFYINVLFSLVLYCILQKEKTVLISFSI